MQKGTYLRELARYSVFNLVRREDWPWSSYWATAGQGEAMKWLQAFGGRRGRRVLCDRSVGLSPAG